MVAISKEFLFHMYVVQGMSDSEISKETGVSTLTVSYLRRLHGITRNNKKGFHFSHELVASQLRVLGYEVMINDNKTNESPFDLLVNEQIRVEVVYSTSIEHDKENHALHRFLLYLTKRSIDTASPHYTRLANGRYRKLYNQTCDVLVFVGHNKVENTFQFWVMPSAILRDTQQTMGLYIDRAGANKYSIYEDAWDVFNV